MLFLVPDLSHVDKGGCKKDHHGGSGEELVGYGKICNAEVIFFICLDLDF